MSTGPTITQIESYPSPLKQCVSQEGQEIEENQVHKVENVGGIHTGLPTAIDGTG